MSNIEIILLQSHKNLGLVGDIVKVKRGYGTNYLIPKGIAIRNTETNFRVFSERKSAIEAKENELLKIAEANKQKIEDKEIYIYCHADESGQLYGAIHEKDILKHCERTFGIDLSSANVILKTNRIKELGSYNIDIDLFYGITANITMIVEREQETA